MLHHFYSSCDIALAGQEEDRRADTALAQERLEIWAGERWHVDVEQNAAARC